MKDLVLRVTDAKSEDVNVLARPHNIRLNAIFLQVPKKPLFDFTTCKKTDVNPLSFIAHFIGDRETIQQTDK